MSPFSCSFLAAFTVVAGFLTAAHAEQALGRDQVAKKLAFYQNITRLHVTFTQTKKFKDMDLALKSTGELTLLPPDQVIWTVLKPSYLSVNLQKESVEIRSGAGTEQKIESYKLGDISKAGAKNLDELVGWLKLNPDGLIENYSVFSMGGDKFKFLPKHKEKSAFQQLLIQLNSQGHLTELEISEKSGDQLTIRFGTPEVKAVAR